MFSTAVNYNVAPGPHRIAVGNFNKDGKIDIVSGNAQSKNISILLGSGD